MQKSSEPLRTYIYVTAIEGVLFLRSSFAMMYLEKQWDRPIHINMQTIYCYGFCSGRQDYLRACWESSPAYCP